jgi:SAM-dependent methyltransferase
VTSRAWTSVHLQCHIGTDTLSLHRLGARVTGVDLSGASIDQARALAAEVGADITYVQSEVYSAPAALGHQTYDLVYTGIGAICWLPDIARWAQTVAELLRPGGRLFIRDMHPVLNSCLAMTVADEHPDRAQQSWISGPGGRDDGARAAVLGAARSRSSGTTRSRTSARRRWARRARSSGTTGSVRS